MTRAEKIWKIILEEYGCLIIMPYVSYQYLRCDYDFKRNAPVD